MRKEKIYSLSSLYRKIWTYTDIALEKVKKQPVL